MKNPFPGVDPWMEAQWGDAHARMIVYASNQIRQRLPPDLKARVEERVYVATELPRRRWRPSRQPDVKVERRRRGGVAVRAPSDVAVAVAAPAVAKPFRARLPSDAVTEGYIEIRERLPSDRLVTVIEVLSPANKRPGAGRAEYRAKQRECLEAGVNLVEVDLLRGGRWTVVAPPDELPDEVRTPAYRASVWRSHLPNDVEVYPFPLRDRLPAIAIPLREADVDVPLDLQPLVDEAYETGDYDDTEYGRPPVPRLSPEDAAWAETILRAKGLLDP